MKSRKIAALALTGVMVAISLSGCGASDKKASEASQASSTTDSNKKVLRVGMECAYAPFNWTQDTDTTPDGSKAVKIYDSDYYAYFESYLVIAVIYFVLCFVFDKLFKLIEKKMQGKTDYALAIEYMDNQ